MGRYYVDQKSSVRADVNNTSPSSLSEILIVTASVAAALTCPCKSLRFGDIVRRGLFASFPSPMRMPEHPRRYPQRQRERECARRKGSRGGGGEDTQRVCRSTEAQQ